MRGTRPHNNRRLDQQPSPNIPSPNLPSPNLDGSWIVVDEDDPPDRSKTPEWENCEGELVEMLAPPGISTPPKAAKPPASAPVQIPSSQNQAQQFQRHVQNVYKRDMARSVEIPRATHEPVVHLMSQSVVGEAEAMRNARTDVGPALQAAGAVAEWGREIELQEDPTPPENQRDHTEPAPAPSVSQPPSQPSSQPPSHPGTPHLGPSGRFWGDAKPPISPGLQPASAKHRLAPALSINDPMLTQPGVPEPNMYGVIPSEPEAPDEMEILWAIAKVAVILTGALWLGNKARKRWTCSRA